MNQVAFATQYPLDCPKCGARTAISIAKLLEQKQSVCRHCTVTTPLEDRDIRRIERTLKDVCHYVSKPEPEESQPSSEFNEALDNFSESKV